MSSAEDIAREDSRGGSDIQSSDVESSEGEGATTRAAAANDFEGNRQNSGVFVADGLHSAPVPSSLLGVTSDLGKGIDRDETMAGSDWGGALDIESVYSDDLQNEAVVRGGELSVSDIDEKYNRLLKRARIVSYIGFAVSILQGSLAMGFGISHEVVSLTAMGAQICIDLVSSMMVVWRFHTRSGPRRNPRHADQDTRLREALRERRAALGVGIFLIITALWAASWAFVKVFSTNPPEHTQEERSRITLSIAWPGFVLFSIISGLKWTFAFRLRSRVLQKDAVCSTFGAALSFITALFATIDYGVKGRSTGGADAVAALIMSALLVVEGIRTTWQNTAGWIPPSGVSKETVEQYYQSRRIING